MTPRLTFRRAEVTTPTQSLRGRFFFLNGTFALWEENRPEKTAVRLLFGTDAQWVRSNSGRIPNKLIVQTEDGVEEWGVKQLHGGGSCCGNHPITNLTFDLALDPDRMVFP